MVLLSVMMKNKLCSFLTETARLQHFKLLLSLLGRDQHSSICLFP